MDKVIIDIGGTSIKIGFISLEGNILDKWEIPTNKTNYGTLFNGMAGEIGHIKIEQSNVRCNCGESAV